ncbi:2-hydroxyacyl-CoA dehydratase [candidate division WOR-3 bacterium]|nr:2-hydroxyacyl-CoA dehydratase [candidate division WOR-3 bacterium]
MGVNIGTNPHARRSKRIGYTCPYIPVEILASTGLQPYCLLHGDFELMQYGTTYARIDACPLVRANIAHILKESDKYAAIVGSTGCDMSRRLLDVISEETEIPVLLIHMPRTNNFSIYSDEIDWLVQQLDRILGVSIKNTITLEIDAWQHTRDRMRVLDEKRYAKPSMLATHDFHKIACTYYQGFPAPTISSVNAPLIKPQVFMVGSEISYESGAFLQLFENDLTIVGDNICGLSQFLSIQVKESTIAGIKKAYYFQAPCIYRRPNHQYYNHVAAQLNMRGCRGVIGFTLDYCDAYEFELKRLEKTLGVPVLRVRIDYAGEKVSQLKTRVAAFGEMLCSKI